uniref:Protein-tyrosine-phosphatase n=1 Tax=Panagrellus redivivus TaxID=6233 RepID=A0A7E4V475_PANRE
MSARKRAGEKTDAGSTRTRLNKRQQSAVSGRSVTSGHEGHDKPSATERRSTTERQSMTKRERDAFTAEAKAAMKQFTLQTVQNGIHSLRLKYAEMKGFTPADPSKTHFEQNLTKSRYKDVPCWDKTRIVLTWPPGVPGDFVHANRVTHELLESQQFICAQGPLDSTVGDFWRCVWQEKVKNIIMLCKTQEMGKDKCAQYYPLAPGGSMTHHGLTIKCDKVDTSDRSFIHTKLTLTYEKESRVVDHRAMVAWPDKSVPKTPMAPFRMLQYSRKNPKNVTLIHCSAGVGRTGTLVIIEMMYRSLTKGKIPDVAQLVKDVRSQRSQAVQVEDQYLYCHYSILQLLHIKNAVPSHLIKHFIKEYEHYLKLLNDNGGKNLPIQATSAPNPCAMCTRIANHINDPKNNADSPPSDSKKVGGDSKREISTKEVAGGGGGAGPDRRATLMKKLKTQKEKKSDVKPKSGTGKKEEERPSQMPSDSAKEKDKKPEAPQSSPAMATTDSPQPTQSPDPGQTQIPTVEQADEPPKAAGEQPLTPALPVASKEATGGAFPMPEKQPDQPGTPPPVVSAEAVPNTASATPQQAAPASQHHAPSHPVQANTTPSAHHPPASAPAPAPPTPPQPGKFQYKPAATYTIQHAGGKKAIIYQRNNQPFIKALATPTGQTQPQVMVAGQQPPNGNPPASTPPAT